MDNKENNQTPAGQPESLDTLEGTSTVVESPSSTGGDRAAAGGPALAKPPEESEPAANQLKPPKKNPLKALRGRFAGMNIYLAILLAIVVLAIGLVIFSVVHNKNNTVTTSTKGETLTPAQISALNGGTTVLGNTQQNLTVQSNATFTGSVLVQKDLNVAGDIKLAGSLNLPSINVSGNSNLGQVQANKLTISGDAVIAGQLSVGQGMSVAGSTTFNGSVSANQLTTQSFTLNGELNLNHHINAGGITPSRTPGSALGNGGTASLSGSDTAGSITINTGSSAVAGCFITVTFNQAFNSTPHIVVTPVGAAAAGIDYYINRSTTNFSLCTTSVPPAGQTFGFDYLAFD